jgi:cell division protein FtsI (penicillin-binding protein 3)
LSGALDDGAVTATDTFDAEHGSFTYQGQTMHDASTNNGVMSLSELLAVSSNVGITKVFDRMAPHRMEHWLRAFHLGQAPSIDGASAGALPAQVGARSYAGAVTAIGETAMASPLQMAAVYATIANGGAYVAPTTSPRSGPAPREQIMKPETARTMTTLLEAAVNSEHATGKKARVDGVTVAGKTGTASWDLPGGGEGRYASFVGFVPSNAPRFVIIVGVEQPRNEGSGGEVAAPVFARVASRSLSK